jgi:hypothetical protein
MQSLFSNGCVKILFICCTYKEQNRRINNIQEMKLHTKNVINELMLILEKFRNKYHQIWIMVDGEKSDTKFDCRLKGEKQTVLYSNRPGPAPSLATMVSLPGSRSGKLRLSFLYRLLMLTRGSDTFFSELKFASLKYYTP